MKSWILCFIAKYIYSCLICNDYEYRVPSVPCHSVPFNLTIYTVYIMHLWKIGTVVGWDVRGVFRRRLLLELVHTSIPKKADCT